MLLEMQPVDMMMIYLWHGFSSIKRDAGADLGDEIHRSGNILPFLGVVGNHHVRRAQG